MLLPSPIRMVRVRFYVQNLLGACVTYQIKEMKKALRAFENDG